MKIPNIRLMASLIANRGTADPLHTSPELHVMMWADGLPAPIEVSERVSDIALLSPGIFDAVWSLVGREIKKQLEASIENSRSNPPGG